MAETSTTRQAAESGREMGERLREGARDTMSRVQEGASQLRDTATEYMEKGRAQAQVMGEQVQETIEERPLTSVLIAAAFGFLLGVILMRR